MVRCSPCFVLGGVDATEASGLSAQPGLAVCAPSAWHALSPAGCKAAALHTGQGPILASRKQNLYVCKPLQGAVSNWLRCMVVCLAHGAWEVVVGALILVMVGREQLRSMMSGSGEDGCIRRCLMDVPVP